MTPTLKNPDTIDWTDTRRPEVRQNAILGALENLFPRGFLPDQIEAARALSTGEGASDA